MTIISYDRLFTTSSIFFSACLEVSRRKYALFWFYSSPSPILPGRVWPVVGVVADQAFAHGQEGGGGEALEKGQHQHQRHAMEFAFVLGRVAGKDLPDLFFNAPDL